MTDEERYLFDLQGYLVVDEALTPDEVAELNQVIDAQPFWADHKWGGYLHTGMSEAVHAAGTTDPNAGYVDRYHGLFLGWGEPCRRLVGHPRMLPYLQALIGGDFRLDHAYAIFMRPGHPNRDGHRLHGGGTPYDPSQYYHFRNGRFYNGLVAISYALTDVPPGTGGLCCIPGSHKSCLPIPARLRDTSAAILPVRQVPVRAGSAVVFTEALAHGTLPWDAPHQRRVILYKYAAGHMRWERESPFVDVDRYDWTPAQRRLLEPPHASDRVLS